jgi:chorismate dehydratase
VRISVVDFLNARPLVWGFLTSPPPDVEIARDLPSACADKLRDGRADAGLIPSIEFRRIPDLIRVAGLGIAADSEVRSVLLVSSVSREKIRTLKFDPASRTSVALVQILLKRRYGIVPEAVETAADAELVIGDPALKTNLRGRVVLDLAAEWRSLTGHPFVFAFWAMRKSAWRPGTEEIFRASYRASMESFDAMIDSELSTARDAGNKLLSRAMLEDYLRHSLHYELTAADLAGLDLFYRWAEEDGLVEAPHPLSPE